MASGAPLSPAQADEEVRSSPPPMGATASSAVTAAAPDSAAVPPSSSTAAITGRDEIAFAQTAAVAMATAAVDDVAEELRS